ncbi:hypothetical protein CL629_01190 [bacterium]|nr:hypothetical protein [bacterium]
MLIEVPDDFGERLINLLDKLDAKSYARIATALHAQRLLRQLKVSDAPGSVCRKCWKQVDPIVCAFTRDDHSDEAAVSVTDAVEEILDCINFRDAADTPIRVDLVITPQHEIAEPQPGLTT